MGEIRIDGRTAILDIPPHSSTGQAFEIARDKVLGEGRVIAKILVDRIEAQFDDSPVWKRPFDPSVAIDLETAVPIQLSLNLMDRILEILPTVAEQHRSAAADLRSGATDSAIKTILEVMPWWRELREAFTNVLALHEIEENDSQWGNLIAEINEAFERISRQLSEFREAVDLQDFVLVADILEYELAQSADDWQGQSERFRDRLIERFGAPPEN